MRKSSYKGLSATNGFKDIYKKLEEGKFIDIFLISLDVLSVLTDCDTKDTL